MGIDINKELIAVDKAFSALSMERGMNYAFTFYVAEGAVMLTPNRMPIVGKSKIESLFQSDDSKTVFTWAPLHADIAKSGDLGYTYGTYNNIMDGDLETGTYVSVWKKNTAGEWKFVLDSGNRGLGEK